MKVKARCRGTSECWNGTEYVAKAENADNAEQEQHPSNNVNGNPVAKNRLYPAVDLYWTRKKGNEGLVVCGSTIE